ncbi:metal ABC transporter substrate-binding protein [Blautia sp. Sow4_E7]|uniref:metal ABC transporter substrate-binding protein n=1 Tax=Blautia sp. Sow4_E7 TaxID=3438749 RepID=UPI003F927BE7
MYKLKNKFRQLFLTAATVGVACLLAGCGVGASAAGAESSDVTENQREGNGSGGNFDSSDSQKLQVVTTIFPEYDWVKEILGDQADNVDLTLLLGNGTDMHSFQPTMADILKVSTCDVFIYVGGESDSWVADVLKGAGNPDRKAINLMEVLGDQVKEEEVVEGMQDEDGHTHVEADSADAHDSDADSDKERTESEVTEDSSHDSERHSHDEGTDDDLEYDEHVWLSLKNASLFCNTIASTLADADPEHAQLYQQNAAAYEEKLAALDQEYQATVDKSQFKTLLFADRFPFRYLTDDYNLTYYAAFTGCSAETDASFETITFLAGKLDELKLPVVLTIENSDQKVAKAVIENTNTKDQKILTLNSMQSVTAQDVEEGTTYLSIMENNLQILKEAL